MKFQLTKLSSKTHDVISVYRSSDSEQNNIEESILNLIDENRRTIICGDFNICFRTKRSNRLIKALKEHDFKQMTTEAYHLGGGHIDHVYTNHQEDVDVSFYSPYYCAKDHDALLTVMNNE